MKRAQVSKETLDEFLAEQGILGSCEERAIEEIVAEWAKVMEPQKCSGGTDQN